MELVTMLTRSVIPNATTCIVIEIDSVNAFIEIFTVKEDQIISEYGVANKIFVLCYCSFPYLLYCFTILTMNILGSPFHVVCRKLVLQMTSPKPLGQF